MKFGLELTGTLERDQIQLIAFERQRVSSSSNVRQLLARESFLESVPLSVAIDVDVKSILSVGPQSIAVAVFDSSCDRTAIEAEAPVELSGLRN